MSKSLATGELHDRQPEIGLLRLATKGVDTNLLPSEDDFVKITDSLKRRRLVILFRWFWRHGDVARLAEHLSRGVYSEGLEWYLTELSKIVITEEDLHWVERINLFHVYGLSRLFGKEAGVKLIEKFPYFSKTSRNVGSLADLSACNVALMLKEAEVTESIKVIDAVSDPSLLAQYGMYQIYYYKGMLELIDKLKEYASSPKQSIIPQTIAGIFEAEPHSLLLTRACREMIYDELIVPMPGAVAHKLETLDKRHDSNAKKVAMTS